MNLKHSKRSMIIKQESLILNKNNKSIFHWELLGSSRKDLQKFCVFNPALSSEFNWEHIYHIS